MTNRLRESIHTVNSSTNNGPIYALVALIAVLVSAVALVLIFGGAEANIDRLIAFVGTVVPMVLGYAFLSGKVNQVSNTVDSVHENVNGKLDKRLDELSAKLDSIGGTTPVDITEEPTP